MKWYAFVHPGFEDAFVREVLLLFPTSDASISGRGVVEGTLHDAQDFVTFLSFTHLPRRLCIGVGQQRSLESSILLPSDFPWELFFTNNHLFRVEVEGVPSQENRLAIAKQVAGTLFSVFESKKLLPKLELRNSKQLFIVYFDGENYFFGIDPLARELDAREYRVFAHAASFRGDCQAFFLSLLRYSPEQKLLVGFAKDGSAAIEAAMMSNAYPFQYGGALSALTTTPFFSNCTIPARPLALTQNTYAFDETTGNMLSTRKNATIAGVLNAIHLRKQSIEDLDVSYGDAFFDCALFHLTRKDEEKLNEIYYQSALVLKPRGKLLIVSRASLELPISEKFKLLERRTLERGQSLHQITLLERQM